MVKLIKQRDEKDGGPTCLAMVAEHHSLPYDMDQLRELCDLCKDTGSLLGINKAAEAIGLKTVGGQMTFKSLTTQATLPCIVQWDHNHFVVVYRIKKLGKGGYKLYVADPDEGMQTYSWEEFCVHWTGSHTMEMGAALLLEPSGLMPSAEGVEHHPYRNRLKFLWGYLRRYRHLFTQMILGLLLGSLLQLIIPLLTQAVVDTGIGGKDIGFIWLVLLAQLMLLLSRTVIDFIRDQILLQISTRLNISLI